MMKTWVATDPSSTEPVVDHGDKKAAARLEKKKKYVNCYVYHGHTRR